MTWRPSLSETAEVHKQQSFWKSFSSSCQLGHCHSGNFLKSFKKRCEQITSEVICHVLMIFTFLLVWLGNAVRDNMSFHVPFQGWLWTHVEAMQPRKKRNSAVSVMKGSKILPWEKQSPPTMSYSCGDFRIDLASMILFTQLLSALKGITFRFYHIKYHKFSSGICSFLELCSFTLMWGRYPSIYCISSNSSTLGTL